MFDLDKIDEAASKRRLTLMQLAEQLKQLDGALADVARAHAVARELAVTVNSLDDEGKRVLGMSNSRALLRMHAGLNQYETCVGQLDSPGPYSDHRSGEWSRLPYSRHLRELATQAKEPK